MSLEEISLQEISLQEITMQEISLHEISLQEIFSFSEEEFSIDFLNLKPGMSSWILSRSSWLGRTRDSSRYVCDDDEFKIQFSWDNFILEAVAVKCFFGRYDLHKMMPSSHQT